MAHVTNKFSARNVIASAASVALGASLMMGTGSAEDKKMADADRTAFDASVMATVEQCAALTEACATSMNEGVAVLVFPEVIEANLIVGGSGGKGALIENGQITGYYKIGGASAGFQAGIDGASQVYVFDDETSVNLLKADGEWSLGGEADITVFDEDASAQANTDGIVAFVFDSEGFEGGASIEVLRIWEAKS